MSGIATAFITLVTTKEVQSIERAASQLKGLPSVPTETPAIPRAAKSQALSESAQAASTSLSRAKLIGKLQIDKMGLYLTDGNAVGDGGAWRVSDVQYQHPEASGFQVA